MKRAVVMIDGMSCNHCVMRVKKALEGLSGMKVAKVEIGKATVEFDDSRIEEQGLTEAIQQAGYRVVKTEVHQM